MIEITTGNLLEARAEALVNTVNTVGVMGKGIALQFKKAFPENFKVYQKACSSGELHIGAILVVPVDQITYPKFIINFPTKAHWRAESKLDHIEKGLVALVEEVKNRGIRSIAIPPLGCGNGGLAWRQVRPLIEAAFAPLTDVHVLLFEPNALGSGRSMVDNTKRPNMTQGRAAILCLMSRYLVPGYMYRLSMLEVQKLAYFMQEAGENLKLKFEKASYGPYADDLRKVLRHIDGHFIEGYGDGEKANKPGTPIKPLAHARNEAEQFLIANRETQERFSRVTKLIDGFETSYGMELLSTVHWVMKESQLAADNVGVAVTEVQSWNERKKKLLAVDHIQLAWNRLKEQNWA
jgi:O-acetyl-ADP-ribose deacetylase (regulator of RNase III)